MCTLYMFNRSFFFVTNWKISTLTRAWHKQYMHDLSSSIFSHTQTLIYVQWLYNVGSDFHMVFVGKQMTEHSLLTLVKTKIVHCQFRYFLMLHPLLLLLLCTVAGEFLLLQRWIKQDKTMILKWRIYIVELWFEWIFFAFAKLNEKRWTEHKPSYLSLSLILCLCVQRAKKPKLKSNLSTMDLAAFNKCFLCTSEKC